MKLRIGYLLLILATALNVSAQRHGRSAGTYGGAIPQGTQLQIRMIDSLSSATARPGQTFRATLEQPVIANGRTLYPKGADVTGQVIRAHSSGRLSDPGELELVVTQITANGLSYPVSVEPLRMKGESHTKSNVTKIGGGAAAGAVVGGIAAGSKGAIIGAGVGAAGGTAVAAATGKKDTTIQSEAVLGFVTGVPPSASMAQGIMPAAEHERDRHAGRDDDAYDESRSRNRGGFPQEISRNEREIIRSCMTGSYSNLPPGLAKRGGHLPPGLEKQVQRNGQLPPGLQKRVQPMPEACTARLPRLPSEWARVILGRRVILLDKAQRIIDLFTLDEDEY